MKQTKKHNYLFFSLTFKFGVTKFIFCTKLFMSSQLNLYVFMNNKEHFELYISFAICIVDFFHL